MNRKILVPLDGSELAEKALHYARVPAARIGAEVVLLHVCSPEECHSAADRCTVQPMHRVYTEHTAEMLRNELREVAANTIAVECKVLVGDPASEIVRFAEEQGVTRIIMASHGRSGVGRWIMGSVTDRVVRVSPVPVVIIRASAEDSARSESLDRQILVLLDGSAMSEQVLPYAMEHAEMSGRGTVLLTVCETHSLESSFIYHLSQWDYPINEPIRWEDYRDQETTRCKEKAKAYLEGIEKRFTESGLKVKSEILCGRPADEIVDYLKDRRFNLIAMTTHGRSGLSRWAYGSVADRVLHATDNPVLLVRSRNAAESSTGNELKESVTEVQR